MSQKKLAIFSLVPISFLVAFGVFASSAISINSGNSVALGAGSQIVTSCDSDVNVDPPGLTLDPLSGKLMITTISVSNVSQKSPNGCGNWIMELAASSPSGTQITSWSIPSSSIDTPFYFGASNSGTHMAKSSLTPIDPTQLTTIALQMYPGTSCADGGVCGLGDVGPDGGPIIYVASTPFTEPVSGKTFRYIEAAPTYWIPTVVDPQASVCSSTSDLGGVSLSENIGYSKSNTDSLLTHSQCTGTSTATSTSPPGTLRAAALVRTLGADWNLPSYKELIEMCKVARFGPIVAPTKTNCYDSGGSSSPSGWSSKNYVSSSKTSTAGQIDVVNFSSGAQNNSSAAIDQSYPIRAIKYL